MFTIYRHEEVSKVHMSATTIVHYYTSERRNSAETIAIVFDRLLYGGYYEITNRGHVQKSENVLVGETLNIPFTISAIEEGDIIYRYNGVQFGYSAHSDYRQCLDIVKVSRVCEKTIRGTNGEIVRPEQIICVTREDV